MERKSPNRVECVMGVFGGRPAIPSPRDSPPPRSVRSALGVVAGVALIRGAIYTAAATSTFTHTSAMSFTLLALVIAAGVT